MEVLQPNIAGQKTIGQCRAGFHPYPSKTVFSDHSKKLRPIRFRAEDLSMPRESEVCPWQASGQDWWQFQLPSKGIRALTARLGRRPPCQNGALFFPVHD